MNEIFPRVRTTTVLEALSGAILKISHSKGKILAIATNEKTERGRSIVVFNGGIFGRSPVVLAENWPGDSQCLSFEHDVCFEISAEDDNLESWEQNWRNRAGVIFGFGDELYIRATLLEDFSRGVQLINIRNGQVFRGSRPNDLWAFGVWHLYVKGPVGTANVSLRNYNVHHFLAAALQA